MRFKVISLLLCLVLLFSFSGCFSEYITIPCSSDEYIALIVIETMVLSFCGCSMITNRVKKSFNSDDNSLFSQ